jgi:hypothetical protein
METPAKTALGGALISALAIGGMVAAGVTAGVVTDPGAPPVRAGTALVGFENCNALLAWYVDHTIDRVGPYGWDGRLWPLMMREPSPGSGAAAATAGSTRTASSPEDAVGNATTGTNTQETGIDEPDVAKTDGRVVVRLENGRRLVVTDVSGSTPRDVGMWRSPPTSHLDGLLLVGHHVLLTSSGPTAVEDRVDPSSKVVGSPDVELIDLNISDPSRPLETSRTSFSGRPLSLRQHGDTVRLVSSTGLPALPFVQARAGRLTEDQATQRNREIVRASTVDAWLPRLTSTSGSAPLVGCDEVYHPTKWSGPDTVTVASFRPGAVSSATAVAVTGAGEEVYSSTDRLYVTSTDWGDRLVLERPMTTAGSDAPIRPLTPARTNLHAFSLDGAATRYVASGTIDGTIRDRWSLDEHDGHLRVAVSWPDRDGNARENGIVVLDEKDGVLEPVGELRGLGVDEQIQSVRWFDDLAVLVTFRQTDPLYTVDLTEPTHPRELGSLEVPGFSSYLHPIGGDRLLGIGTDATRQGRGLGAQAGIFDTSNLTRARQVGKVTFGEHSLLGAAEDPHAFTWLPGAQAAITTLERRDALGGGPALVLLRVAPSGGISAEDLPSPGGWQQRALPLPDGRVALVGSAVRIVEVAL